MSYKAMCKVNVLVNARVNGDDVSPSYTTSCSSFFRYLTHGGMHRRVSPQSNSQARRRPEGRLSGPDCHVAHPCPPRGPGAETTTVVRAGSPVLLWGHKRPCNTIFMHYETRTSQGGRPFSCS